MALFQATWSFLDDVEREFAAALYIQSWVRREFLFKVDLYLEMTHLTRVVFLLTTRVTAARARPILLFKLKCFILIDRIERDGVSSRKGRLPSQRRVVVPNRRTRVRRARARAPAGCFRVFSLRVRDAAAVHLPRVRQDARRRARDRGECQGESPNAGRRAAVRKDAGHTHPSTRIDPLSARGVDRSIDRLSLGTSARAAN